MRVWAKMTGICVYRDFVVNLRAIVVKFMSIVG